MKNIDLIELMNIEYQRRTEKNASYSLRSFARDLDIQAASLSHILRRKRVPSKRFRQKVYALLKLSVDQINLLEQNPDDITRFDKREMDVFISLSDWYYDAIMELVRTKNFESQSAYVAKRLNLTEEEADNAIKRLFELKLLKETQNKTWVDDNANSIVYGGDETNFALQKLQRQLMEKSIESLEKVPKKNREQASMVMSINRSDLPEAKTRIKDFHQELCKFLQRPNREPDEVYQLITTLFPLTVIDD